MIPRLTLLRLALVLSGSFLSSASVATTAPAPLLQRLIVLSDIEADPDDTESMVRLMLYSDVIDLQGLIATTSTYQRTFVSPDSIRAVIRAYGQVQANLVRHDPNYPTADRLLALVKQGLPVYGLRGVGVGQDSEGSDWIVHVLEQPDPRPLWVTVWGGPNTLAQALFQLRATCSAAEVARLIAKLRVYAISDQDDSGLWIRRNFPDLFYVVSPGGYGGATWGGINQEIAGIDNTTIGNRWLATHIQQGHGPLGAMYPDVAYGMEGDTPSWLNLIPNGLSDPEHPDWGGWGGRYELYQPELSALDPKGFTGGVPVEPEPHPIWTNASDDYTPPVHGDYGRAIHPGTKSFHGNRVTIWRWRDAFQHDFAARMAWTSVDPKEANHPPVPQLRSPAALTVKSGEHFELDARDSTDPDGDSLSFYWQPYPEAGTCHVPPAFDGAENLARVHLVAPKVTTKQTVHIVLEVTDKGSPPLTRYRRVIVTVLPD